MATLNYSQRLTNIQNRKFDRELNESLMSKSFSARELPENVKYLAEAMRPIDKQYNDKTLVAAGRVQKHLEDGFSLHFNRAYKTQGSVSTDTNIKVHSDFDLLTIIDRYHYNAPEIPNESDYTSSNPDEDILELRKQATKILKSIYDEVDDSGEKSISVYNKSLNRKIDIVFCFWYHCAKYIETKNEYYRGVYLYKFPSKTKVRDYPFAHINNVNHKGNTTNDGSRRAIRLLKNLKADSESKVKLSSFHLTSIIHPIENSLIRYNSGSELDIAKAVSTGMNTLILDNAYRKGVKSPNGTENPFSNDDIVAEMKILKADLDTLIEDCSKEIYHSPVIQKAILKY